MPADQDVLNGIEGLLTDGSPRPWAWVRVRARTVSGNLWKNKPFTRVEGIPHIGTPGNMTDPWFATSPDASPHDSMGDDGRSTGPFQQQSGAGWGWGGALGDCDGTRRHLDMVESTCMFYGRPGSELRDKSYDASNAQQASDSIQAVQQSGVPWASAQWWDQANQLDDQVVPPTPQPGPILPPDYAKQTWDQLRIEWPQLSYPTVVNALRERRDKVLGVDDYTNDYTKWKAAQ